MVQTALYQGRPYALAFVDVRMPPDWDGVETTQKIWEIIDIQIVICIGLTRIIPGAICLRRLVRGTGFSFSKSRFDAVEASQLAYSLTEKWWLGQQSRRKVEELEWRVAERTRELQPDQRRAPDGSPNTSGPKKPCAKAKAFLRRV